MVSYLSNEPQVNGVAKVSFDDFKNVVDGSLRSAQSSYHGVNPSTKEKLWDAPIATTRDVDDAVAAGHRAFSSWKKQPWTTRRDLLRRFATRLMNYKEQLVDVIMKETGKPPFMAEAELAILTATIEHFVELTLPEETVHDDTKFVRTRYMPLGVVAAIGPWNFPVGLFMNKLAPALLAGNTIILKPSPYTPYSILKVAEIAQQVFPPGVVQALGGGDDLGPVLTHHPDIQKIAFTGSVAAGKKIMAACASTVKRVTLELGGNDPAIVCPDVDIDKVAGELIAGFFLNAGQVCVAPKRVFIHEDIYPHMAEALVRLTQQMITLDGKQPGLAMGPLQNQMQYEKVKGYLADCGSMGHKFLLGSADVKDSRGFFIPPTFISQAPEHSRIMAEEQFGPVVPLASWSEEVDVIRRANDTETGLSACVWSNNVQRARQIGQELEVGSVYINSTQEPSPMGVFGGHKQSGLGVEFRLQGLLAYCNAQSEYVCY